MSKVSHVVTKEDLEKVPPMDRNLVIVTLGYSTLVLPYEDGMQLIESFLKAEIVEMEYDDSIKKIKPLTPSMLKFGFMSEHAYKKRKMELLIEGD